MIRSQYFERSLALLIILSSMWTWIFIQKVLARRVIIWRNLIKVCLQHGSTFETTPTTSMMCGGDEVADELQCVEQWRGQSRVRENAESGFDAVSGLWSLRCSSKSCVLSTWFWSTKSSSVMPTIFELNVNITLDSRNSAKGMQTWCQSGCRTSMFPNPLIDGLESSMVISFCKEAK